MPKPIAKTLNITLYQNQRTALAELQLTWASSAAQVIRTLITAAHSHAIRGKPTCPNGSPCMVPQMHPTPEQVSSAEKEPTPS